MRSTLANSRTLALVGSLSLLLVTPELHSQTMTPPASPPPNGSGHATAASAQMLLNFITSVNRDEITAGKLAMTKATTPEVREYARRMVEDHTNAMTAFAEKAPALSLKIPDSISTQSTKAAAGTAAMANGVSEVRDTTSGLRGGTTAAAIHSANLATLVELRPLSGALFEKAYLSAQIKGHEAVLKELTAQPAAYTEMQTLLTTFRETVEKHLSEARKLQP